MITVCHKVGVHRTKKHHCLQMHSLYWLVSLRQMGMRIPIWACEIWELRCLYRMKRMWLALRLLFVAPVWFSESCYHFVTIWSAIQCFIKHILLHFTSNTFSLAFSVYDILYWQHSYHIIKTCVYISKMTDNHFHKKSVFTNLIIVNYLTRIIRIPTA